MDVTQSSVELRLNELPATELKHCSQLLRQHGDGSGDGCRRIECSDSASRHLSPGGRRSAEQAGKFQECVTRDSARQLVSEQPLKARRQLRRRNNSKDSINVEGVLVAQTISGIRAVENLVYLGDQ